LPKEVYYSLWKDLLKRAELHERDKLTWYSLRHTYATFRLLNGLSVFVLAKNLGTSVKFIEEHYGHVETAQMRDEIAFKKPKINEK
jgi:site-specific recombinase XerD